MNKFSMVMYGDANYLYDLKETASNLNSQSLSNVIKRLNNDENLLILKIPHHGVATMFYNDDEDKAAKSQLRAQNIIKNFNPKMFIFSNDKVNNCSSKEKCSVLQWESFIKKSAARSNKAIIYTDGYYYNLDTKERSTDSYDSIIHKID